jgi:hypothetical protein
MRIITWLKRIFKTGFRNKGFRKGDIIHVEDNGFSEHNGIYKIKKVMRTSGIRHFIVTAAVV